MTILKESLNIPQTTNVVHKVSGHAGVVTTALGDGWYKVLFYTDKTPNVQLSKKNYHYSMLIIK